MFAKLGNIHGKDYFRVPAFLLGGGRDRRHLRGVNDGFHSETKRGNYPRRLRWTPFDSHREHIHFGPQAAMRLYCLANRDRPGRSRGEAVLFFM